MPGTWTEPSTDATAIGTVVQRGGSRYVRVPADWPAEASVRLLLLPATPAAPSRQGHNGAHLSDVSTATPPGRGPE